MSVNSDETEEAQHMPSWLVEDNDKKHIQETVTPLFGSGTLSLLDSDPSLVQPFAPPSQDKTQMQVAAAAASYGSTGVTSKKAEKQKGKQERTTEQAANEIKAVAQAYGKMQQQKQQAEENRRLFSQQQKFGADDAFDGASENENSSKASSKKKNSKIKKTDEFGTIESRSNIGEDDDDDDDENINDEEKQALLLKEQLKPHMPKQNACLWFFHLLSGFSVVVLLCLVATQIIPVVAARRAQAAAAAAAAAHGSSSSSSSGTGTTERWWQTIGIFSLALKLYISFFALVFCLVELQVPLPFLRSANVLQNFISRGFIYSFVGLVATSEAYQEHVMETTLQGGSGSSKQSSASSTIFGTVVPDSLAGQVPWEAIFMQVSAWVMLGIGFFYIIMGLFCLQPLFERLRERERLDWQKYRTDYRAWTTVYGNNK